MTISIEVPRVALSPNKLLGRHWYAKHRERHRLETQQEKCPNGRSPFTVITFSDGGDK